MPPPPLFPSLILQQKGNEGSHRLRRSQMDQLIYYFQSQENLCYLLKKKSRELMHTQGQIYVLTKKRFMRARVEPAMSIQSTSLYGCLIVVKCTWSRRNIRYLHYYKNDLSEYPKFILEADQNLIRCYKQSGTTIATDPHLKIHFQGTGHPSSAPTNSF